MFRGRYREHEDEAHSLHLRLVALLVDTTIVLAVLAMLGGGISALFAAYSHVLNSQLKKVEEDGRAKDDTIKELQRENKKMYLIIFLAGNNAESFQDMRTQLIKQFSSDE